MMSPSPMYSPRVGDDDVSIRCKVRRSFSASKPEFEEVLDMTCTMRNWEACRERSSHRLPPAESTGQPGKLPQHKMNSVSGSSNGPELLLCPIHLPSPTHQSISSFSLLHPSFPHDKRGAEVAAGVSYRFHSFGSTPLVTNVPRKGQASNFSFSEGENMRSSDPGGQRRISWPKRLPSQGGSESSSSASEHLKKTFERLHSLGSDRQSSTHSTTHDLTRLKSYVIPISDILVLDTDGVHTSRSSEREPDNIQGNKMNITTMSNGYFEFLFESKNAHDVMYAFLQPSLPPEKITSGEFVAPEQEFRINQVISMEDSKQDSYDMQNFTAKKISDRFASESVGEKWQRRLTLVASRFSEMSDIISDKVCCEGASDSTEYYPTTTVLSINNLHEEMLTNDENTHPIHHGFADPLDDSMFSYEEPVVRESTHLTECRILREHNMQVSSHLRVSSHENGITCGEAVKSVKMLDKIHPNRPVAVYNGLQVQ